MGRMRRHTSLQSRTLTPILIHIKVWQLHGAAPLGNTRIELVPGRALTVT
jgi:hypothetical protein